MIPQSTSENAQLPPVLICQCQGKLVWEYRLLSAPWSGILSTAGGLVFSGSNEGNIFALDARSGNPLWNFHAGGAVTANPISLAIDGHQHIAMAANRVLYVFGL